MSIYVSMVPSSEVSYQEVGRSSAVAKNNDIAAAPQQLLTFRGCTVHETRPFDMVRSLTLSYNMQPSY